MSVKVLFSDSDKNFSKASAQPRLQPPVLKGGMVTFPVADPVTSTTIFSPHKQQKGGGIQFVKAPANSKLSPFQSTRQIDPKEQHNGSDAAVPSTTAVQPSNVSTAGQYSEYQPSSPPPSHENEAAEPAYGGSASWSDPASFSTFAPDAGDVHWSIPEYAPDDSTSIRNYSYSAAAPSSPTYVREASPEATWAVPTQQRREINTSSSPTYSYTSPPYDPPEETRYYDRSGPESPTYDPNPGRKTSEFGDEMDEGDGSKMPQSSSEVKPLSFAERMMAKMGYKEGKGLGKEGQGRTSVVETSEKLGRTGLGHEATDTRERKVGMHIGSHAPEFSEESDLKVHVSWFESEHDAMNATLEDYRRGLKLAEIKLCDCLGDEKASPTADYDMLATRELAQQLKDAKNFFDPITKTDTENGTNLKRDAMCRANKWELTGKKDNHFFMSRAALKMAELDWLFNFTARAHSNPPGPTPSSNPADLHLSPPPPPPALASFGSHPDPLCFTPVNLRLQQWPPCAWGPCGSRGGGGGGDACRLRRHDGQLYFADICSGPGGFTEYLYWRRQRAARGWGFTLKARNFLDKGNGICQICGFKLRQHVGPDGRQCQGDLDFRLDKFNHTSPYGNFKTCYGHDGTGNIYSEANMRHFAATVEHDTEGLGVVLVTGDGGVDEGGDFNKHEWTLRRLVLCQVALGLLLLREGGNMALKIFDTFTPFIHDLLYIMSRCFAKTAIIKPFTSRPASSERYIICIGLRQRKPAEAEYLLEVNNYLDDSPTAARARAQSLGLSGVCEVFRLVDPHLVPSAWTSYIKNCNLRFCKAQLEALQLARRCYEDPMLQLEDLQIRICKHLLACWGIPKNLAESNAYLKDATPPPEASRWADHPVMYKYAEDDRPPQIPVSRAGPPGAGAGAGVAQGVGAGGAAAPQHQGGPHGFGDADVQQVVREAGPAAAAMLRPQTKKLDFTDAQVQAALLKRRVKTEETEPKPSKPTGTIKTEKSNDPKPPNPSSSAKEGKKHRTGKGGEGEPAAAAAAAAAAVGVSVKEEHAKDTHKREETDAEREERRRQRKLDKNAAAPPAAEERTGKVKIRVKMPTQ